MELPTSATADAHFGNGDAPSPVIRSGRVGRYQLQQEIGRGFSSVVFQAVDLQRQRTVALKVLTFLQSLSPERRADLSARFAREARAISALSHPNIVAIYEVGKANDGREFIAMERLAGETLRARLARDGALPPEEAVTIALQLADALQYAHGRGIVHRDVKPDNVFLLPDGRVKLMDFGVAHVLSDQALTQTGTIVGSPAYMSPEQINGEHLDGRSDVFSLGIVLAEMVTGLKPFEAPTIPAVMHRILTRPPQTRAVRPRALRRVIEKALSKHRQGRFGSAALLADSLRCQVLPELPLWEPTSTQVMPLPAPLSLTRHNAATGEHSPAPLIARWGAAAGAALAAALFLAFFHVSAQSPDKPTPGPRRAALPVLTAGGIVRHIPAYWRRSPAPRPASRSHWAVETARVSSPAAGRISLLSPVPVRIVENKTLSLVKTVSLAPRLQTTAPAVRNRPAARLAVTHPVTPRLQPLVVRIAASRQERAIAPPTAAPVPTPAPADQDMEQIGPAVATPPGPPSAAAIPDAAPRLLHRTPTLYPNSVPPSALGETVTLRVSLDAGGDVSRTVVVRSSGIPDLDEAAMQTVKDWEYVPAFRNGQNVPSQTTAQVRFPR